MERLPYSDETAFTLADDAATVQRIARTVTAERLRGMKFAEWTALEVLGHVTDMAEVFAERVRRMVGENKPRLLSVDQDAVHAKNRNNERDPMEFARRTQAAHSEIVRLLADPKNRARLGIHGEWGEVDAAHVAAYQAKHAHEHVSEVAARFPPSN